eukprot:SAG11_NODE_1225_length_5476_cov_7.465129_1_plen_179_part_10
MSEAQLKAAIDAIEARFNFETLSASCSEDVKSSRKLYETSLERVRVVEGEDIVGNVGRNKTELRDAKRHSRAMQARYQKAQHKQAACIIINLDTLDKTILTLSNPYRIITKSHPHSLFIRSRMQVPIMASPGNHYLTCSGFRFFSGFNLYVPRSITRVYGFMSLVWCLHLECGCPHGAT